jgi:hypothetical protein
MYQVIQLESPLPDAIATTLNAQEQEGWSLVCLTHDRPGTPAYCILHKLPSGSEPRAVTGNDRE